MDPPARRLARYPPLHPPDEMNLILSVVISNGKFL
jgi:hypothetical protein